MAGNILHFGAVRLRAIGSGNLIPTFYSMDKVSSSELVPIVLSNSSLKDPTRLGNFVSPYTILRLETRAINEVFKINRVTIYVKQMYTSFPG